MEGVMWRILAIVPLVALAACGSKGGGADGTDVEEEADAAVEAAADGSDVPVEGCVLDEDCDDGDPCTMDACNEFGECVNDDLDADGDGYIARTAPDGTSCGGTDCDDDDDGISPSATPGCSDAEDLDCNDIMDLDNDDDGYDAGPGSERDCGGDDCDDEAADVHPGGAPDCSETVDHDCNGHPDIDNDGDGHDAGEAGGRDCGGDDCDDAHDIAYPGAEEVCLDGIDGDCDGIVDGLVPMRSPDVDVSYTEPSALDGALAWTGSQYGIVFSGPISPSDPTDEQVRAYTASETGSLLLRGENRITPTSRPNKTADVIWTGSQFVVGYEKEDTSGGNADIYMAAYSTAWVVSGGEVAVYSTSTHSEDPALVWTGSRVGMCWSESLTEGPIKCTSMLATGGGRWGTNAEFTTPGRRNETPDIAWSGSEFGVVWEARPASTGVYNEVYFQRLGADGSPMGARLSLDSGFTGHHSTPRIAWAGSRWAAVWAETLDMTAMDAHLQMIAPDGTAAGSSVPLSASAGTSGLPVVAWTGSEIVAAWTDFRAGASALEVYMRTFDAAGAARSDDILATPATAPSSIPDLVMTPSEVGMVWTEQMGSVYDAHVYFNRFGFCE